MAQISRLKEAEIQNGHLINADDLNSEFDQLITESNAQDLRLTQLDSQAVTVAGIKTFSDGIKTDLINERNTHVGVTVDGVLLKDGMVTLTGEPTQNGQLGYHNDQLLARVNEHTIALGGTPAFYIGGPAPFYNNTSSIKIPAGLTARDSTNAADLVVGSELTVSLASNGANALDAGAVANNTFYYLYLIGDSTGTNSVVGLFSATNEAASGSVTLPSGYDLKRQLPLAVRTDGSSNIMPVDLYGWPHGTTVLYRNYEASAPYRVVDSGTATSWTTVSVSSIVPALSKVALIHVGSSAGSNVSAFMRPKGSSSNGKQVITRSAAANVGGDGTALAVPGQEFEYKKDGDSVGVFISVYGYIVTEVV